MALLKNPFVLLLLFAALVVGLVSIFWREEAASAYQAVDQAADQATGSHAVRVGNELKDDFRAIVVPRNEQLRKLGEK
jgi:hypothetical protein